MTKPGRKTRNRDGAAERARAEEALEIGLRDTFPASDPVAVTEPGPSGESRRGDILRIERHDKSHVVELSDGTVWRVWPGDVSMTLQWVTTTELILSETEDEFCSHVLVSQTDKSRVRVIDASKDWPVEQVREFLKGG
jgi:hypothetical protein